MHRLTFSCQQLPAPQLALGELPHATQIATMLHAHRMTTLQTRQLAVKDTLHPSHYLPWLSHG